MTTVYEAILNAEYNLTHNGQIGRIYQSLGTGER